MGNACGCAAGITRSISAWQGDAIYSNRADSDCSQRREAVQIASSGYSSRTLATFANNKGKHPNALYDIEKKTCGTGAFGTVKKAKNRKTQQVVAIKQLEKGVNLDLAILKNEIEINTMMDHPNIVRMYDTFEDKVYVWIAMEACDGGEMFDLVIEQGSLHEGESAIIMEQIFRAINYLHSHSVAHRDLKPENFLLAKKGQKRKGGPGVPLAQNTLKVIDFGIAKRFKPGDTKPFKTKAGTPYYIAPEILDQRPKYNEKCDIWSCGVILYILLSGSPPFAGDTDKEILEAVKRGKIALNIPEFKVVTNEAKELITMCVERDVQKRLTAQQALGTAWIKTPRRTSTFDHDPGAGMNVVAKLKAFSSSSNRFKKAAIHIIAHHIDDDKVKQLRDVFTAMDANGDGELTIDEVKAGCKKAGLAGAEDLAGIFDKLDADGNGSIGYSEFLTAMLDHQNYAKKEQCWEAFRVFDKDGNGKITVTEFNEIMKDYDESGLKGVNMQEIAGMFKEADRDGDGEIDFDEFVAMMQKT